MDKMDRCLLGQVMILIIQLYQVGFLFSGYQYMYCIVSWVIEIQIVRNLFYLCYVINIEIVINLLFYIDNM